MFYEQADGRTEGHNLQYLRREFCVKFLMSIRLEIRKFDQCIKSKLIFKYNINFDKF